MKWSTHLVHFIAGLSPASHPLSPFVVTYNAQKIGSSFSPAPGGGEQEQQTQVSSHHSGHAPRSKKMAPAVEVLTAVQHIHLGYYVLKASTQSN